jgi:arylsulfatase A-like enzyme
MVDLFIIMNFNTHLTVTDFLKYASYATKYLSQVYRFQIIVLAIFSIPLFYGFIKLIFDRQKLKSSRLHIFYSCIIIGVLILSYFLSDKNDRYVHAWMYRNFIDHHLMISSEAKNYSQEFIDHLDYSETKICVDKIPEKRKFIILMVESLSSYQSEYFSGIKNWTPNLDSIAKGNLSFHDFYANGFTTEDGEISLLLGQLPIYPPYSHSSSGGTSFDGYFHSEESLPVILNGMEYSTEFLTSADLSFSDTGEWARSIGFDYVEGHEHPYYTKWERYHFEAAPDEALYNRVISRVETNEKNDYFIFVKTTTTHHPFINPENGRQSEEETFRYADMKIKYLYDQLERKNFFVDGTLIIVGDHHAMVPLKSEEVNVFGENRAYAKVPLVIIDGNQSAKEVHEQYQQIDVYNYIKSQVSDRQCYSDWIGDIHGLKPAKYIAHRRGDNRNLISVFQKESECLVALDGDETKLISDKEHDIIISNHVLDKINFTRIKNLRK